jgi:integrase
VTPHECRHAFENFLEAAGVWPTRAERYFGHSDPTVTGRYRHQLPGQLEADAALLDEYVTGAVSGREDARRGRDSAYLGAFGET